MAANPDAEILERIDELIRSGVERIADVIAGARRPERRLELVRVERADEERET